MFQNQFRITPPDPPNDGIMFANMQQFDRSGHLGHALVEYAPGKILAFFANCSAEDQQWKGHSGYGWMEYRRSEDGGETWSDSIFEPHSKALFDRNCGRTMMCEKAVCTDTGRIVLFYLTCDVVTNGHIWEPYCEPYYAFSEDGGETFSQLKSFTEQPGRVFDALYQDGVIYVMYHASDFSWKNEETEMQLWVSEDNGETFQMRCVMPYFSMIQSFYGTMLFLSNGDLLAYSYDEFDEHNLKYLISHDKGFTWETQRRAFFDKSLRNPQLVRYGGKYWIHGRSGSLSKYRGSFVIYNSDDAIHWSEGQFLRMQEAGSGSYSNNLVVHCPDGRERLLIQTSHAYEHSKTNTIMFWIDQT